MRLLIGFARNLRDVVRAPTGAVMVAIGETDRTPGIAKYTPTLRELRRFCRAVGDEGASSTDAGIDRQQTLLSACFAARRLTRNQRHGTGVGYAIGLAAMQGGSPPMFP